MDHVSHSKLTLNDGDEHVGQIIRSSDLKLNALELRCTHGILSVFAFQSNMKLLLCQPPARLATTLLDCPACPMSSLL